MSGDYTYDGGRRSAAHRLGAHEPTGPTSIMALHDCIWPLFLGFVTAILFVDLFVLHRRDKESSTREALLTVSGYVALAMAFAAGVFVMAGADRGSEFLTGYLVEQSLSFDNNFVIALIFTQFSVPGAARYRVLFYGVAGAIVMRLALIVPGAELVQRFAILGYGLGALLVWSGYRMWSAGDDLVEPSEMRSVRLLKKTGRCAGSYEDARFFLRQAGRYCITPLFIVLVTVEITDLVFAADSIPAVLAISNDPFIVFSSNVFANLGLRAMFFVLAGAMGQFAYLRSGIAAVLVFIGAKMLLGSYVEVPAYVSLAVTAGLLAAAVGASLHAAGRGGAAAAAMRTDRASRDL
jgi:tellurite resistance protein TerC